MPEFIGFQTLVILDLYEAYFHAVTILSHWPWIFIQVDPQRTVLASACTYEWGACSTSTSNYHKTYLDPDYPGW